MPDHENRRLPFLPLAPTVVVVLGILTAVGVMAVGVVRLRTQSDAAAALRSRLLSTTLAQRLRATQASDRPLVTERAASRSGAEVLLVESDGDIVVDKSLSPPEPRELKRLLVEVEGQANTELGRTRFSVAPLGPPLEHLSVVTFIRAPSAPFGTRQLFFNVAILAAILIGLAALGAYAIARDLHADVNYLRRRIVDMGGKGAKPSGKPVHVRSVDQVGLLTSAFNALVERFSAAEHAYRQDLAEALAHDRDRSEFLAALSHELRTPLNAILGFTDVLLSEVDGPLSADATENLEVVRSSGQHLRALIDDILDLSALESGELVLSPRTMDVLPVAEQVVRELRVSAESKGVRLEFAGQTALAWADPRRVRQIISNILGNAIKFTTEGCVRLEVDSESNWAVMRFTDTGPGIAAKDHGMIFDEYQQVGDQRVQTIGTGLGLAITRRLVKMHGGSIELESSVGVGSAFTIWLPQEEPSADSGRTSAELS